MAENIIVNKLENDSFEVNVEKTTINVDIKDRVGTFLHPALTSLNWADSGHTIDTDIDMLENGLTNVSHIDFQIDSTEGVQEARATWNDEDGTLNIGLKGGNVNLQVGLENVLRATAKQGSDIINGQAVYISGASGNNPEVMLANASEQNGSKTLAIATENVLNNQKGYFTTSGVVRDIDMSAFAEGEEVFLDQIDGGLTPDKLSYPNNRVKIGYCLRSHSTEGVLFVTIEVENWLKRLQAMKEPTGYPLEYPELLGDISFVDGTRTFTIEPKSGQDFFSFWVNAKEFRKTTAESVQITDDEGVHFIRFDNEGVLYSSQTPWTFEDEVAFTAVVYWDKDNQKGRLGGEQHGIRMDGATHKFLHNSVGAVWINGFTPSLTVDGTGAVNEDCEMQSISAGLFYDEDISNSNPEQTEYKIWYKDGLANWRWTTASSSLVDMGATTPYYNEFTGGVWTRTEVSNNDFMLMHIFATNSPDDKIILVMGENVYLTKGDAQEGSKTEILNITTGSLPTPEFVEIASVIIQVRTTYSNDYNARVVSTDDGGDFVDFRINDKSGVGAPVANHGNLTGLTEDDHIQYSLVNGTRPFTGPIGGVDPVSSSDLATKNYVDTAGTSSLPTGYIDGGVMSDIGITTPVMTSDSQDGFIATTNTNADAYLVFNQDSSDAGLFFATGQTAGTIDIQYPTARPLTKYQIGARETGLVANRMVKDWTIKGSNTGAFAGEEVLLDTIVGETGWSSNEVREYSVNNNTNYLYYRFDFTDNNGDADTSIGFINYIDWMTTDITSRTALSTNNTEDLSFADSSLILTDDNDWASGTAPVIELQPLMTSNTTGQRTPAGIVSATDVQATAEAYKALDGVDNNTSSVEANQWMSNTGTGESWNYNFQGNVRIKGIIFTNIYSDIGRTNNITIYKNGVQSNVIITTDVNSSSQVDKTTIMFDNIEELSQFGVLINSTIGGARGGIAEIEFIFDDLVSNRFYVWDEYNAGTNRAIFDDETGSNLDDVGKSELVGYFDTDSNGGIIAGSQVQRLSEPVQTALYRGGDTLFEGSSGTGTINLSQDIDEYKFLEIQGFSGQNNTTAILFVSVESFKTSTSSNEFVVNGNSASTNRYIEVNYIDNTSIRIGQALSMNLTKVVGIK